MYVSGIDSGRCEHQPLAHSQLSFMEFATEESRCRSGNCASHKKQANLMEQGLPVLELPAIIYINAAGMRDDRKRVRQIYKPMDELPSICP